MNTITISKRALIFAALAVVAVISLILVMLMIANISRSAASSESEVEAAAARALSQVLDLDYQEGREAWEARVKPLCTEHGWTFWGGMFFADQVWPMVNERRYTTESIEVVDTRVVGEGTLPDSKVVQVTLKITYTANGKSEEKPMPNRVVMVREGGRWLMDTPPERK